MEQIADESDAMRGVRTIAALAELLPPDQRIETLAQGLNVWKAARLVEFWNAFDAGIQTLTAAMIERWPAGEGSGPMLEVIGVAAVILAETASGMGIPPDWLPDAVAKKIEALSEAVPA